MPKSIHAAPVLAFAVLTSGCGLDALTLVAEGSFTRTLSVAGPVELTVSTGSGSIEVRTGSTDEVRILGRIRAHGRAAIGAARPATVTTDATTG